MTASRPRLTPERAAFAAASSILLGIGGAIALLGVQAREPARLTVELVGDVRVVESQSYLTAQVRNEGDETAQAVQVVAQLTAEGEVIADGEQLIDFLSGGEVVEIVFILDESAPDAETGLRVASYRIP
jgi:uncharacterized protein (TIGR02588 family)